jgi:single-stranded-DNA-specific exonuclease
MAPTCTNITRGISGAIWQLRNCDESSVQQLARETSEDQITIRCLLNRGLGHVNEIGRFLKPQFSQHLHPPFLLRDMRLAVDRLRQALRDGEKILIVTDFDVDGTTSSVIISQTIKLLGGGNLVSCYIPDRFSEGYGLSKQIVERAAAEGFRVIVTADIGIKSHAEARLARELGVDLIICDHHLPDGEDVPADAFAVLCPKGSSGIEYPNKHLAACGVSLKLSDALLEGHGKRPAILASLAKLTAIGTVADMVDLSDGENRAIVAHGLKSLKERSNNPGLRALLKLAQLGDPVTTYDIGFKIGPRINAAGRIAHANSVLALFEAATDEEAAELALRLDALNSERQHIQKVLFEKLLKLVDQEPALDRVLVFSGNEREGFHRGVIGIACTKMVEVTGRPTLICSLSDDGIAHCSARSINGFHMVEALDAVSDLLVKYGGHPMAAGFSLRVEKIPDLKMRINRYAEETISTDNLGRRFTADAELAFKQVTLELARSLTRLEPHGIGNPAPLFLLRNLPLQSAYLLKNLHLKLNLGTEKERVEALWWNAAEHHSKFSGAKGISLMCRLEINHWNGRDSCRLQILDAAFD